jgi:predicted aminopeptidase
MRALSLALAAWALSGCFTAGYLAQAAGGEYAILHGARPLPTVVRDPRTPERVRALLMLVPAIKEFGQAHGLKPTKNYDRYTDLHRPAAVWVVQACAPLAFEVRRWSFPVVSTVPYLGYFDEGAAKRKAESLARAEALDIEVRTASAFSTLGILRDPVLSTMIPAGEEATGELANVILHESVHATLYLRGQSAFNESLASFAADRLTRAYLSDAFGPKDRATLAWGAAQERSEVRLARVRSAYDQLDALYHSSQSAEFKRAEKERVLGDLREELQLKRPINNATLAGFRTYDSGTAELERLLAACGGSWPRFFGALGILPGMDLARARQGEIAEFVGRLASKGCPESADPGPTRSPWGRPLSGGRGEGSLSARPP